MIKSMTGFASLTHTDERAVIGVTVRTLNHRYLDLQIRTPPSLAPLEPELRALAQKRVGRGRLELAVHVQLCRPLAVDVVLNEPFLRALAGALARAREAGLIEGALTPGDLLKFPQALTVSERALDQDAELAGYVGARVLAAADAALEELDAMRVREGGILRAELDRRAADLATLIDAIAEAARQGEAALVARLTDRVRDLAAGLQAEPAAIAQEIVRTAARSDISEEVVRLHGHLEQWSILSEGPEPCGRKLDFLLQEMNREVNTMAAKADGLRVSELIVAAKAELQKMREQVQNVE